MFAKFLIVPLFIASSVVAVPTFVRRDVSLSDWSSQNLESYWTFKMRYNSLNCTSQTGTDFYNTCCSPLGATQSLSDLPAQCTPTTCAAESNSTPTPTPTPTPTDDVASVPTTSASDDNDDDDTYCDEDGGNDDEDGGDYSSDDSNGETSPADTPAPTPTDNDDPAPTDSSDPDPTDNSDPDPTDNNDPAPTDNNDPAPTDDSDPAPTDNNDPTPSQDSSSQDNSQPTPTDDGTDSATKTGGFATYFYQGGNAGACGNVHQDSDLIAAIDIDRYGDTGSVSSLCGQTVHITNNNNGNSVDVVIADACPSCTNSNSIDLSVAAFQALADLSDGMVPISWYFT